MDDCLFCKIVKGEVPSWKVYEDDTVLAFLDIFPINAGQTLVIPKIHTPNIYEISHENFALVMKVVKDLSFPIKKATGADGINIIQNNDAEAGQMVFHSHTKIVPRFKGDGHDEWTGEPFKDGEAERTLEKIQNAL